MVEIKEQLNLYRRRLVKISNIKLDIENLKIRGANAEDDIIQKLEMEIAQLENENKKIDNILFLLKENEYKVINFVYIQGKSQKKASIEFDRTERQINRITKKALKKLEENWSL